MLTFDKICPKYVGKCVLKICASKFIFGEFQSQLSIIFYFSSDEFLSVRLNAQGDGFIFCDKLEDEIDLGEFGKTIIVDSEVDTE